ncbi:MAG: hypothetical protein ABSH20_03745 [Tepidisphaeraceae bacterium]|jgi:hypothetical protein
MSAFTSTGWQAGFLNVLPAVETHARIQFRHLPLEQREDLIQEAIASACLAYQRLAALGRLHVARPSTLASFAVRQARSGRHVGGRQDAAQDVMSPVCQRRRGVRVFSYEQYPLLPRSGSGDDGWKQLVIADRKDLIPDTAAFRIDFERWLKMLNRRDRRIIAAFIRREGTMEVAERFRVSPGRISQLRRQYERGWTVFQRQAA